MDWLALGYSSARETGTLQAAYILITTRGPKIYSGQIVKIAVERGYFELAIVIWSGLMVKAWLII